MLLSTLALVALCQVPVQHQPDLAAMKAAAHEARLKRPKDTQRFLAVKTGVIEPTLAEDLGKHDWLRATGWSYPEKKWGVNHEEDVVSQYDPRSRTCSTSTSSSRRR